MSASVRPRGRGGEIADQRLSPVVPVLREPLEPAEGLATHQHVDRCGIGPGQQPGHQMTADEPGTAGNDIAHAETW